MGADGPKLKEMESPQFKADFTPSTDIWYSDGSVVLVAEKTAFRVHITILASHCEVFKDMFAMPQPVPADPDTETYEGCQVLRLQDSPVDVTMYFRPAYKTKFPIVAAVLRLSTKYHAPVFRQHAIDLLVIAYPTTATAWRNRSTGRLIPPFEDEYISYIELAIKTDVRVILPAVYYAATREPLPGVLAKLRKLAIAPALQWDICSDFLVGRERLFEAELTHILAFLDVAFVRPNCQNGNDTNTLAVAARNTLREITGPEPYHLWCSAKPSAVGPSLSVCSNCCTTIQTSIENGRNKIWEQLPGLFGLPDWETLKATDELGDDIVAGKSP